MADQGIWFKLWCSALTDPHLSNLSLEDFGRWCKLGMLIKQQGTKGVIKIPKPAPMICGLLNVTDCDALLQKIDVFPGIKVVTIEDRHIILEFTQWHRYQVDSSAKRMAKMRSNVTPKKRREEKRREYTTEVNKFVDSWNEICVSLGKAQEISKARKTKIKTRLKERSPDDWKLVFEKIESSSFCKGDGNQDWKASFDWIISNEDNAIKVLEGKYDNREQRRSNEAIV